MNIVLDATAAYDLLTEAKSARHIAGAQELLSPDLIVPELLNARWKVARSGKQTPKVDTIFEFLARLRIVASLDYARNAIALAERLDHPVYDCLYVAVAQTEHAKLLTLDARLQRKLHVARLARILR